MKLLSRPRSLMMLILLISLILRVYIIVWGGGSGYWPDELGRYGSSRKVARFLMSGDIKHALISLHSADHFLFKVIGVIPASIETAVSMDTRFPALFFALFSVCNIWLIWRISLTLGASQGEAVIAAFLLALTSSFFYYSRHLLPYDLAMAFGLAGLLVGLTRSPKAKHSYLCGLFCAACFLSYNGYWTLVLFVMLVHVIWSRPRLTEVASRAWRSGLGLLAPIFGIIIVSELYVRFFVQTTPEDSLPLLPMSIPSSRLSMFRQFISFSGSVTQGMFSEGGTLPFEYLWHAEHFLLILWIGALACCLWNAMKGILTKQSTVGVAGVLFIYGLLFVSSVGLHKFVVYGRLARQLVPFFCLITAHQLQRLGQSNAVVRQALPVLYVLVLLQAAFNFYIPLVQVFPEDFRRSAAKVAGTLGGGKKDLLFVQHIITLPEKTSLPTHKVILRARHPLEFLPYQYEGYTPEQRTALRSSDISMRLITYGQE